MSNEKEKLVLIVEKQTIPLAVVNSDEFILEGIACVFDKANENGRIYTWDEYKPHLIYLNKKIEKNKLVGEMDHPTVFETSLKNITHIVQKLWYDQQENVLRIRVKLIDTDPYGLNARKLVESGYPISISSRAAGSVDKNKKAKIMHIFAFDLVADGGFGDYAELNRISEDLGIDTSGFQQNTQLNENCMNDVCNIDSPNIQILDMSSEKKYSFLNETIDFLQYDSKISGVDLLEHNIKIKKNNSMDKNKESSIMLTEQAMQKFSILVQDEFKRLNKELDIVNSNFKELSESQQYNSALSKKVDQLVSYTNKIASVINEHDSKNGNSDIDTLKEYVNVLAEEIQNNRDYSDVLRGEIENNRNYSGQLRDSIETSINYTENTNKIIESELNNIISYSNMIAESANNQISYQEMIAEAVNNSIDYQEMIADAVNNSIDYSEYLAENSVVKDDFIKLANYTDEMFEGKTTQPSVLTEAKTHNNVISKIDTLLETIKVKNDKANNVSYTIEDKLNKEQLSKFSRLNESQKMNVDKLVSNGVSFNESVARSTNSDAKFIVEMPTEYRELWSNLDEGIKNNIISRAQKYSLDTGYQIRTFWANLNLDKTPVVKRTDRKINESVQSQSIARGYSNDYISRVSKAMDRFQ